MVNKETPRTASGVRGGQRHGRLPLHFTDGLPDPTKPDTDGEYSYWDHVDFAVDTAAKNGMVIAMLPTWGDKFNLEGGAGPIIFNEDNAYAYGKWIAARYAEKENIIWVLGGDRPLDAHHRRIIDAMAKGIREADGNHLITFHPHGGHNSIEFLPDADDVRQNAYWNLMAGVCGHTYGNHCIWSMTTLHLEHDQGSHELLPL